MNSFDGCVPAVPVGVDLGGLETESFRAAENTGLGGVGDVGFVLVAGGLGERLGFSGIKVQLPAEMLTGRCYLGLFCEHILALQTRASLQQFGATPITRLHRKKAAITSLLFVGARTRTGNESLVLPLAIMTSDDTHAPTEALLEASGHFGMASGQITLMKQNKVAALTDNAGSFALKDSDPYQLQVRRSIGHRPWSHFYTASN